MQFRDLVDFQLFLQAHSKVGWGMLLTYDVGGWAYNPYFNFGNIF